MRGALRVVAREVCAIIGVSRRGSGFLVVEECEGSTVTVDHRKTVVSAGVEKSNIVSRMTFATFNFTYYLRSNKCI